MKKIICFLIIAIISSSLLSCNKMKQKMIGLWVIDELYSDSFIYMTVNVITLKEDNTCILPVKNEEERHSNKRYGTWQVIEEKRKKFLVIQSDNLTFSGRYEILDYRKDNNPNTKGSLIKVTLKSPTITMNCSRLPTY